MKRIALALVVLWSRPGLSESLPIDAPTEAATDGTGNEGATDGLFDDATDGASGDATPDAVAGAATPPKDEGCSCRVASAPALPSWPAGLLALALALVCRQAKPRKPRGRFLEEGLVK